MWASAATAAKDRDTYLFRIPVRHEEIPLFVDKELVQRGFDLLRAPEPRNDTLLHQRVDALSELLVGDLEGFGIELPRRSDSLLEKGEGNRVRVGQRRLTRCNSTAPAHGNDQDDDTTMHITSSKTVSAP